MCSSDLIPKKRMLVAEEREIGGLRLIQFVDADFRRQGKSAVAAAIANRIAVKESALPVVHAKVGHFAFFGLPLYPRLVAEYLSQVIVY